MTQKFSNLENAEDIYRLTFSNTDDLIAVLEPNNDFEIKLINERIFEKHLNYSTNNLLGKSFLKIIHPDHVEFAIKVLKQAQKNSNDWTEIKLIDKNKNERWFEIKSHSYDTKNEKSLFVILKSKTQQKSLESKLDESKSALKKITEQIPEIRFWKLFSPEKFEEALKSSFKILEMVIENIPQFVFWKDNNLNYLGCNKNYAKFIGIDLAENIIGKSDKNLIKDTEKLKTIKRKEKEVIKTGKAQINQTERWETNTEKFLFKVNRIPLIDDENGKTLGLLVSYDNITYLKTKEIQLRRERDLLEKIMETSPVGIMLTNKEGQITFSNAQIEKKLKMNSSEIKRTFNLQNLGVKNLDGEIIPYEEMPFNVILKTKKPIFDFKFSIDFPNYSEMYFSLNGGPLFDSDGAFDGIVVIIDDITKEIKTKRQIIESEKKFRNISEKSLMGIIIMQDFKIKYTNGRFLDTIGYSEEEVLNWKPREFYEIIHPDDVNYLAEVVSKKYRGEIKVVENLQFRFISKSGKIYWVEALSNTINYKGKNADLTTFIDITDRKEAEEKLKKSEKRYRSLLKTSTVGIFEVDIKNEKISYINPRLLNILGYKKEELNMEVIKSLLHPNDYGGIYRDLEERDLEFRVFNKNGEIRWLSGKRIRQYNDEGNLVSVRLWLDDITERKKYERLITEVTIDFLNFTVDTQKNIQLLLNTSIKLLEGELAIYIQKQDDDCFKVIDSDNKTYKFNNVKNFGEEIFFTELFNVKHDFPQKFYNIDSRKYYDTDPIIQKYNIKAAYGKLIKTENDFNEGICVFFDENPEIAHEHQLILFLIADALEIENRRSEVKEYLEDQNRMLNEVNQLKSDLLTRTSHELKTPLISIKGFTELLSKLHKSKLDSDMFSIVDGIMDGAKRMEKIINTLIQASKLNQGLLRLNKTEEDLAFLIKFFIDEIKGLINLRNHEIKLNLEDNLMAKFDKERIYEVISNLLVNAVKYTPPGGKISITSKIKNKSIITAVQDNGVGLTEEEKEQLFQQFGKIERYGQGYDLGIEGSGLGLYISKKIVQLHEGKIWAESEGRNRGSTFYFELPLN